MYVFHSPSRDLNVRAYHQNAISHETHHDRVAQYFEQIALLQRVFY